MFRFLLAASALQLCIAASANAQEIGIEPAYGRVNLAAGEEHTVQIKAGGSQEVARILPNCAGFVARGPDFTVDYTTGEAPLVFLAHSEADTTLLINFPDGKWACDDNSGLDGRDPGMVIYFAPSGQYDVWVGTKQAGMTPDAMLRITDSASDQ